MSEKYCVEVLCSGWKREVWINEYETEREAREFYEQYKNENEATGPTPEEYYKFFYLGKKFNDEKGNLLKYEFSDKEGVLSKLLFI